MSDDDKKEVENLAELRKKIEADEARVEAERKAAEERRKADEEQKARDAELLKKLQKAAEEQDKKK